MRSTLRSWLPLAVALSLAACNEDSNGTERRAVLLFTTDEHSQLFASSPELDDFLMAPGTTGTGKLVGGVARRMTVLKAQRDAAAARGVATLTLSSGDFSQGSLASAAWIGTSPELATMARMGYDVVALGNHEFDLGPKALAGAIAAAGATLPPLVLSNINFSGTAGDAALASLYGEGKPVAPWRVLTTSNGIKVGIVSSMGVGAGTVAGAAAPVTFWDPPASASNAQKLASVAAKVQAAANHLRDVEKVDAIVLLGHGGIGDSAQKPGEDELMAVQVGGLDLILSGHSHLFTTQPRTVNSGGKPLPIVQTKPYGRSVGKIELVLRDGGSPRVSFENFELIDVDDRTLPTTDTAFITDLQTRTIGFLEFGLDGPASTALPSFLEATLSRIVGATVHADAAHPGNLWNFPMGFGLPNGCKLPFDVNLETSGESNAMNLDTDAIRATVSAIAATEIGAQAFGPVRGGLLRGNTSEIAFADVYHIAPLGGDPTAVAPADLNPATNPAGVQAYLNTVPGYPLVRINVPSVALRLVFEGTLQVALGQNGDFFVGTSGLLVKYDVTRTPFDTSKVDLTKPETLLAPGWVTFMQLADGTIMYDVTNSAWVASGFFNPSMLAQTSFRSVATTFYVAKFASSFGIPIFNSSFQQITTDAQLAGAVVRRADTSAIKDYEALAQFIRGQCAANNGLLPDEYGKSVPRRVVNCAGGTCP